jgi:Ca2+-binding RTX toxin-like protein
VLEPGFEPRIAFADQGMFDVQSTRSNASATQPFITSNQTDLKLNSHSHQDTTHGMLLGGLDLALRGNKLDNVLVGNTGNNQIAGGRGKDLVTGGSGRDHFIFRNHRHSFDTITDFNAEEDKFLLKGELFSDLFKASGLRKEVIGSVLLLDAESGHLLFSPVGEGSGSRPIKLALVQGLEAADFSADLFLFG